MRSTLIWGVRIGVTPIVPNDSENMETVLTGSRLKRASTNPNEGAWLTKLAGNAARGSGVRVNILELVWASQGCIF